MEIETNPIRTSILSDKSQDYKEPIREKSQRSPENNNDKRSAEYLALRDRLSPKAPYSPAPPSPTFILGTNKMPTED
jgi:hypothetical protein